MKMVSLEYVLMFKSYDFVTLNLRFRGGRTKRSLRKRNSKSLSELLRNQHLRSLI